MKERRLALLFIAFLAGFGVVTGRIFLIAQNHMLANNARAQTEIKIQIKPERGNIYDRNGCSLTGGNLQYFALSVPGQSAYGELFRYVTYKNQKVLYQKRNSLSPFFVEVNRDLTSQGIYTYAIPARYPDFVLAPHLLGYLDGDGKGASGIEYAFDDVLRQKGSASYLRCVTTARGALLSEKQPDMIRQNQTKGALFLTLESTFQRACEAIAKDTMKKGCIVVLDTDSAQILASVSVPRFNPESVSESIKAKDTSLMNRVFCKYNVGSVFKPILAAAALEKGWDWYTYNCKGAIDVDHQIYHCAENKSHGEENMKKALGKSCNCYFIDLGRRLGAENICVMAEKFGFGQPTYLGGGMKSAKGNLPNPEELKSSGQLANLSFGQGKLLATPLQVAAAFNVIASDGAYRTPAVIQKSVEHKRGKTIEQAYKKGKREAITEHNAKMLRKMLQAVVEEGIGKEAAPEFLNAGGKTGTAQTGMMNKEGEELMNYWFAGFYPAEHPKYTIVVMQDGIVKPEISSARIFSKVCDALYWLEKPGKNS